MNLKTLLQRIALQQKDVPENLESYLEDFVPNILTKSQSLMQAFGIKEHEMEMLYEQAYDYYQKDHYLESLALFRWLILLNSYETKYWMGYAATQQLLEHYEKALHGYAVVALLDCENPQPHYHAYECYMSLGEKKEAEKALNLADQRRRKSS